MFNLFKRKKKNIKQESNGDIRDRILKLCEDGDYGIISPPLKAQVALNELYEYLLGEDYYMYITVPMSQEQINAILVYAIECKYKNSKERKRI